MPADTAMKFMIWASYYNGLELAPEVSFADMTRDGKHLFGEEDAARLDRLKDVLFKCFEACSVSKSIAAMKKAKEVGEQCPFSEESLNALFGNTL